MKKVICILLTALDMGLVVKAQKSLLPAPINSILYNESDPILNGKGSSLLLKTESAQEPAPYWSISYGGGNAWSTPALLDGLNFSNKTIKNISPAFNFDGSKIFFSSNRYGGIGQGDIWFLQKSGNSWNNKPTNLGMPINSKEYESDPFLAPDEKTLYFVRYNTNKTSDGQQCGDIYVATLSGKIWTKPQKLPAPVNTGCECNPQMLNDNKTLVFASQRQGGKGSYDLYETRQNDDNTWTEPVPLAFQNTEKDDRGISIPAQGNLLYAAIQGKSSLDIQRSVIPTEFQPSKTSVLTVKTLSNAVAVNTKLAIRNLNTQTIKEYLIFADRDNLIFLHAPNSYELLFMDPSHKYLHHTEYLDLSDLKSFEYKNKNVELTENYKSWQITLPDLFKEDYSLNPIYNDELKRIESISAEKNDTLEIEIHGTEASYAQDSVAQIAIHQNLGIAFQRFKPLYTSETKTFDKAKNLAIIRFKKQ